MLDLSNMEKVKFGKISIEKKISDKSLNKIKTRIQRLHQGDRPSLKFNI